MAAGSSNSNVSQVMANAAALIAAKKQREREEAMKREADQKRQLQQREMTPDNLRVIEKKLIEFQQQQHYQEGDQLPNGQIEHLNGEMQFDQQQTQIMNQQHTQVVTQEQQLYEQQSHVMQQQQSYQQQTQVHQQQSSIQHEQTQIMTQQQQSYEQQSQVMQQQQQSFQQQTQVHHQQSYQQQSSQQQQEQYQIMNNNVANGFQKESSMPPIPQHHNGYGSGSGGGSVPRDVRGSSEMTYMSLLPEDGSMPHRTNPIGETVTKRSQSVAATPDREIKRKWSISSSTDYLNKPTKEAIWLETIQLAWQNLQLKEMDMLLAVEKVVCIGAMET